jgi:type IX secretion system PorP/SprF family membrane protein
MKKALTILALLASVHTYAQQDPYYTHFKDVIQAFNPADAGHKQGEICLSALTHHQWRDYNDETRIKGTDGTGSLQDVNRNVAPVTYNLNVATVFNIGKTGNQFLGAGLTIVDDKIGYTKSTAIKANLNYKMQLQGGFQEISGGIGIGAKQWGWVKPDFKALQALDPGIPALGGNKMLFDLSGGVMFKQQTLGNIKNFYAGLSVTNLTSAKYQIAVQSQAGTQNTIEINYVPHYYTIAGGDIEMANMTLEPAILLKYGLFKKGYRPQVDLNMTALFAQTFRGGLAFRQWGTSDALSILLGYQKGPLQIGYSYDITLSNVQAVSNGTHEILVKYCIPIATSVKEKLIIDSVRFL